MTAFPVTVLGTGNIVIKRINTTPAFVEQTFWWGRQTVSKPNVVREN